MIIYQILMIVFLNVIVPILIGGLFQTDICKTKLSQLIYRYVVGFFVMLAIYQILEVPMALLYVKFHVLVIVYSIALLMVVMVALLKWKKDGSLFPNTVNERKEKIGVNGWIYLGSFFLVLMYQLYHTIFFQLGDMSLDDATYLAHANDACQADLLFLLDPYTGGYHGLNIQRVLQSSLVYPAFVAKVTGINVLIIMHTIWPVFLVLMAYGVYYLIAEKIYVKPENKFLFLFLIALLYSFGLYSHYSASFRLLGVIWQGKGILAVVMNFLYLYLFSQAYKEKYNLKTGILLCILSIAAVGLTLGGVISTMVISGALFFVFWISNRDLNNIKYILWANVMPILYAVFYLLQR